MFILDCANILYYNSRGTEKQARWSQLEAAVKELHKVAVVKAVIRNTEEMKVYQDRLERMPECKSVVTVPTGPDDPTMIQMALQEEEESDSGHSVKIVTNDQFREHVALLEKGWGKDGADWILYHTLPFQFDEGKFVHWRSALPK